MAHVMSFRSTRGASLEIPPIAKSFSSPKPEPQICWRSERGRVLQAHAKGPSTGIRAGLGGGVGGSASDLT